MRNSSFPLVPPRGSPRRKMLILIVLTCEWAVFIYTECFINSKTLYLKKMNITME
jgi:hypothetical protein